MPEVISLGLEGLGDVATLGFLTMAWAKLRLFSRGSAHAVPLLSSVRMGWSPAAVTVGPSGVALRITGDVAKFTRTGLENRGFLTHWKGSDSFLEKPFNAGGKTEQGRAMRGRGVNVVKRCS